MRASWLAASVFSAVFAHEDGQPGHEHAHEEEHEHAHEHAHEHEHDSGNGAVHDHEHEHAHDEGAHDEGTHEHDAHEHAHKGAIELEDGTLQLTQGRQFSDYYNGNHEHSHATQMLGQKPLLTTAAERTAQKRIVITGIAEDVVGGNQATVEFAAHMLQEGCYVYIGARTPEQGEAVVAAILEDGRGRFRLMAGDLILLILTSPP